MNSALFFVTKQLRSACVLAITHNDQIQKQEF